MPLLPNAMSELRCTVVDCLPPKLPFECSIVGVGGGGIASPRSASMPTDDDDVVDDADDDDEFVVAADIENALVDIDNNATSSSPLSS